MEEGSAKHKGGCPPANAGNLKALVTARWGTV